MILAITTGVLLLAMLAVIVRAILGPTFFDRVLAVNNFGTLTVLFIAVFGYLTGRPDFLDIALVYALINFIVLVAVLKYFEYGDIGKASDQESTS